MTDPTYPFDVALLGDSEMASRIRSHDWEATPLGPIENWSPRLRMALTSALRSRFQFVIYWGPELICLYNDAEIPTLGEWHPGALGQPASVLLATMWDVVGPQLRSVQAGGPATWSEDKPLLFDRSGSIEEAFFTYSYSPICSEGGTVEGVLLATYETTRRVVGERHLRTMQEFAFRANSAASTESVCAAATETLTANPDILFAYLYLREGHELRLAASSGLAAPHVDGVVPFDWPLSDVLVGGEPRNLGVPALFELGVPGHAIAVPISDAGSQPAGVLVVGITKLRPIDEQQLGFLALVAAQIGAAVSAHRAVALASAAAEREQIERDLHDGVQQQWIAARIKAALARDLIAANPDRAGELLGDVIRDVDGALVQLRDVVHGVHPALLEAEGLMAALDSACRRSPIDAQLWGETLDRLEEPIETGVYYFCLEALQNAAKHGRAETRADVRLERFGNELRIRVADTGPGFDRDATQPGTGLQNMRARIESLGGSFELTSESGRGTTVSAIVPLPAVA